MLVNDRVSIAAGDAGVLGQPMGALFTAQERWTGFEPSEPFGEIYSGDGRNARDETTVQVRTVNQAVTIR